jgi:hypothetical protein
VDEVLSPLDSAASSLDADGGYDAVTAKLPLTMRGASSSGDGVKMRVRNGGEKTPIKRATKNDFGPLEMDNSVDGFEAQRVISVAVTDESVSSGGGVDNDDDDDEDLQEIVLNTDRVPLEEREDKVIWTTPANEQRMDEGVAGGVTECSVTSIKLIMRGAYMFY